MESENQCNQIFVIHDDMIQKMASEAASETSAGNIPGGQPENPTDIKDFKVKTMQGIYCTIDCGRR